MSNVDVVIKAAEVLVKLGYVSGDYTTFESAGKLVDSFIRSSGIRYRDLSSHSHDIINNYSPLLKNENEDAKAVEEVTEAVVAPEIESEVVNSESEVTNTEENVEVESITQSRKKFRR